jgi:hypothetical protein
MTADSSAERRFHGSRPNFAIAPSNIDVSMYGVTSTFYEQTALMFALGQNSQQRPVAGVTLEIRTAVGPFLE